MIATVCKIQFTDAFLVFFRNTGLHLYLSMGARISDHDCTSYFYRKVHRKVNRKVVD